MKNLLTLCMLLSLSSICFSQKNKKAVFLFWDSTGKAVDTEKDASFFTVSQQINDTCWQSQNYAMRGPLVSSEQFKDKAKKVRHGQAAFMRPDGTLDSTGAFVNGNPDGRWIYYNQNGMEVIEKQYVLGELVKYMKIEGNGRNAYDTEASFDGGAAGWQQYLIQNLRYPEYALNNKIQGQVKVAFAVDERGRVRNEMILKSVEFTLDYEALRLLRESPKWIPATIAARKLTSYRQQGIQFRTE